MVVGLKKTWDITKQISNDYISMIETNNLFEVSLGRVVDQYGNLDNEASKYYTKAINFQNEMNEKLATNKSELMQYQAMYFSMFKSQGINKDSSYLMSESLTKAGYDIASLYNLNTKQAVEKIRAGIAGQVEPLRAIGIDISESALTRVLNDVGIDRTVQQLSYAEKEVARYIAIINQAGQAQGDFARTFEQPANQLRVFKNQLQELSQVAGAFVVNAFGGILVYANAIVMAIKEILKAIASLLGWNLNTSGSIIDVSDTVGDINTGLGGAVKKAKEFKKQLMGFDEINNITLPTDSKSGGSGGIATGIDNKLLNALKEWDNKMSSISGKAQQIRDKILEWLGFSKDFDGNLKWAWKDMNNIAKIITVIAGVVAGITILGKIVKLISWLKNLFTIVRTGKGAVTSFGIGLQTLSKGFSGIKTIVSLAVEQFLLFRNAGDGVLTAFGKTASGLWSLVPTVVKVTGGIAGLAITAGTSFNAMRKLSDGTIESNEAFKKWGISIAGAVASGAILGSTFGPIGTMLGALGGLVISVTAGFLGYEDELEKSAKRSKELSKTIEETNTSYEKQKQAIKESAESKIAELEYTTELKNRLSALVDENGKVLSGYEGRVDFILGELNSALGTQYKAENGIIKNYQEMQIEIENLIKAKKKEIEQEAYLELYRDSIKKQIQDTKNQVQAEEEYNKVISEKNKLIEKAGGVYKVNIVDMHKYNRAIEKAEENLKTANETLANSSNEMMYFEQQVDNLANNVVDATGIIGTEVSQSVINTTENMKKLATENTSEFIAKLQEMNESTKANILAQTTTISTLTPEVQAEWNKLATGSRDTFVNAINQVPTDTQGAILRSITEVNGLTDSTKDAWTNLSKKSKDEFEKNISQIDPITQSHILATIAETEGLTENTKKAWANLANTDNTAYNAGIASIDKDTANKIQSAVDEINNRQTSANQAGDSIGTKIKSGFDRGLGDTGASARNFVQGFINIISGNPLGILQVVGGLANSIISTFNKGLGNASPSKKTKKSALYFAQGFQLQLNKVIPETIKQVSSFAEDISNSFNNNLNMDSKLENLSKGVQIDTRDFEVDTNNFIDYGKINGRVESLANVEIKADLIETITNNLAKAINDKNVNVEITAKTDKGTILETSVNGIKEYVKRTGDLPFPVPV